MVKYYRYVGYKNRIGAGVLATRGNISTKNLRNKLKSVGNPVVLKNISKKKALEFAMKSKSGGSSTIKGTKIYYRVVGKSKRIR